LGKNRNIVEIKIKAAKIELGNYSRENDVIIKCILKNNLD
jgi:hypothetical protein